MHKGEQIAELVNQGMTPTEAARKLGLFASAYYSWKSTSKKREGKAKVLKTRKSRAKTQMTTIEVPAPIATRLVAVIGTTTDVLEVLRRFHADNH